MSKEPTVTKDVKAPSVKAQNEKTTDALAAKRIIELEKENAALKEKLALVQKHVEEVDPEVLVKYKGRRKSFVFRGFDFSEGTCKMLRSEARALIAHDSKCFGLV